MRLQLALNVRDLDRSIDYYSRLFGVAPHKRRPGYANFAITDPPLKLVLFENRDAAERINHLGVEVQTQQELDTAIDRLEAEHIAGRQELDTTCCHSTQDKIWSSEPDGLAWEWYRITSDTPVERHSSCCG